MSQTSGWHVGSHEGQPLVLPPDAFLRHAVVFGASGSGKTVACKVICEEALKSGIPVIAVDPQGDIASMQMNPPDGVEVVVWTPGSDAGRALRLNPFGQSPPSEPTERTLWIGRQAVNIAALLGVADDDEKTSVIEAAITHALDQRIPLGSLEDLAEILEVPDEELGTRLSQIAKSRVPPEVARILRRNSFGARSQILERGEPMDIDVLFGRGPAPAGPTRLSVIYLNVLLDQESKSSFLGFLLEEVYAWMLRNPSRDGRLQALLFIDELAPFVPPSNRKKPPCKEAFLLLIRQARKYGLGLLLASQNIGDVDYQALNQCNTWLLGSCRAIQELNKAREVLSSRVSSPQAVADALPGLPKGTFLMLADEVFGDSRQRRIEIRHYDRAHRPLDVDGLRELKASTGRVSPGETSAPDRVASRPAAAQPPPVVHEAPQAVHGPTAPAPVARTTSSPAAPCAIPASEPAGFSARELEPAPAVTARPAPTSIHPSPQTPERTMQPVAKPFPQAPATEPQSSGGPGGSPLLDVRVRYRTPTLPVSPHGTQLDVMVDLVPAETAKGRAASTLLLLLDRSGSMGAHGRLDTARQAAITVSRTLRDEDHLGLIAFNETAELLTPPASARTGRLELAVTDLLAGGGTRASAALELADRTLRSHHHNAALFFLTDGHTQSDHERCYQLADDLRARKIPVFGYGVGTDWDPEFLDKVTRGAYEFLEKPEDAPKYFEAKTRHLSGLFARELRVTVETVGSARLLPAVLARSSSGLESETDLEELGTGPVLTLTDVSSHGGPLRLSLSFEVAAPAPGQLVVARLRVEGSTESGERVDVSHLLVVPVSQERTRYERVDADVVASLQRIHTKRVLVTAHRDVESGDPERVARGTRRLRGVTKRLDDMGEHDLAKITRRVVEQLDANPGTGDSPELKALRQQTKRV